MFGELVVLIPSILLCSLCDSLTQHIQLFALAIWLPRSTSFNSWPASCNRACQKIVLGTPGFEDFVFLIHFAHFRSAAIVI